MKFEVHVTAGGGRQVILRDLVILGHVGIEIVFAVELGAGGDGAV